MVKYQLPIIVTLFLLSSHLYHYHQLLLLDFVNFVLLVRFFFLIAKFFYLYIIYPLAKNKHGFHTMLTLNLSFVILTKIDTCLKYAPRIYSNLDSIITDYFILLEVLLLPAITWPPIFCIVL